MQKYLVGERNGTEQSALGKNGEPFRQEGDEPKSGQELEGEEQATVPRRRESVREGGWRRAFRPHLRRQA